MFNKNIYIKRVFFACFACRREKEKSSKLSRKNPVDRGRSSLMAKGARKNTKKLKFFFS